MMTIEQYDLLKRVRIFRIRHDNRGQLLAQLEGGIMRLLNLRSDAILRDFFLPPEHPGELWVKVCSAEYDSVPELGMIPKTWGYVAATDAGMLRMTHEELRAESKRLAADTRMQIAYMNGEGDEA